MTARKSPASADPFFAQLAFTGVWRDYQARVLEEIDAHLSDDRIHCVAAPGSGKTILGLEIARRIGRPALVLAPTRTIRNQWPDRLVPLFATERPSGISSDLTEPKALTVATYQALHAAIVQYPDNNGAAFFDRFKALGPMTLVLDEAHHLRREWWKALQDLIDQLPDLRIVALTATPPYDASFAEWSRYSGLCGPIDLEVSVPELVRNGDLCPHQDHIIFSRPTAGTLGFLQEREAAIGDLRRELTADPYFLEVLNWHPWITATGAHEEEILDAPQVLSAILVFLASCGQTVPDPPLELLGVKRRWIPEPTQFWLETLLNAMLDSHTAAFACDAGWLKALRTRLASQDLIESRRVRLSAPASQFKLMAGDLGKLESIAAITKSEAAILGPRLRLVVLSDFVREADLPRAFQPGYRPAKLGVVPVFATLLSSGLDEAATGVLTGTLTIIPMAARDQLQDEARQAGVSPDALQFSTLRGAPEHLRVTASGEASSRLVGWITRLFEDGAITVLIGTQALLGEGWDAPAINSLVLASNSAAFMLSNQMRGRAIRISPRDPHKVSNIWHLATVKNPDESVVAELRDRLDWGARTVGDQPITSDIDMLQRRFRAFEGIANTGNTRIESGLDRLALDGFTCPEEANRATMVAAQDREATRLNWERSLGDAPERSHVREVATPNYAPRGLAWRDTIQWLGTSAALAGMSAAGWQLQHLAKWVGPGQAAMVLGGAACVATLPRLARAVYLLARNGSLEGCLDRVAHTIVRGLADAGILSRDDQAAAHISVEQSARGQVEIVLRGVSRAAEREILSAIEEVLGPVQNPRYLLVRQSFLGALRRIDYHSVPAALARRQEWAENFSRLWNNNVGSSKLVFCRTAEGRRVLLKARSQSLAAGFQRRVARFSAWL